MRQDKNVALKKNAARPLPPTFLRTGNDQSSPSAYGVLTLANAKQLVILPYLTLSSQQISMTFLGCRRKRRVCDSRKH